jgi:hypothetical protein
MSALAIVGIIAATVVTVPCLIGGGIVFWMALRATFGRIE